MMQFPKKNIQLKYARMQDNMLLLFCWELMFGLMEDRCQGKINSRINNGPRSVPLHFRYVCLGAEPAL
jgi:hypothetical protein